MSVVCRTFDSLFEEGSLLSVQKITAVGNSSQA